MLSLSNFEVKHASILTKKTQGVTSLNRATACTVEMAIKHIDDLADELSKAGIMTVPVKVTSGTWTGVIDPKRVFNFDETPQFIHFGTDRTVRNIHYYAKGEACTKVNKDNRECVTITPMVCLNGDMFSCQVLFAAKGIRTHMAPQEAVDKIDNLLISVTECGSQTGKSLMDLFKQFDKWLTRHKVVRPVCVMTDGHGSRFSELPLLNFCKDKQIWMFVSPPDTTSVLQPLDQINSVLHTAYRDIKKEQLFIDEHVNREGFMMMLARIWPDWARKDTVRKAFKRCGVSDTALSTEFMQKDKFEAAKLINPVEEPVTTPQHQRPQWEVESPNGVSFVKTTTGRSSPLNGI